ncbi:MAG: tRNA (guanine-N1)-methyltransferase [Candidatus Pacearchaeota archaeon]|nr:tRNA (guanine-N1)-methyltransferase [Candidatus Pacearchaeota archaeon]
MRKAFDVIGNVAILQAKDKKTIDMKRFAQELLKRQKNIKSVFFREKIHGRLRVPKLKWLAGSRETETFHKESGCIFKLNVKTCYFSPRLGTDRLDIAKKVKKGEKVLVMFSGVAPYPIIIAKYSKAKRIYAIELGKEASKYAKENIKLNKIENIVLIQGDVKKIIPKIIKKIKFDRIIMTRPQLKEDFLKYAFLSSKKGTTVHFYDFVKSFEESIIKINNAAKKTKNSVELLGYKKVREIAPYKYHVRIDFKIL